MTDALPSPNAADSRRDEDPRDFQHRHLGSSRDEVHSMLDALGLDDLEALVERAIPRDIRVERPLRLELPGKATGDGSTALSEREALDHLRELSTRNHPRRSCIGMGYHESFMPGVIQRNILESPGWYTAYTPYQAEIAQGRLEALLNFQSMIIDLTGLEIANASLLDEATAVAEAMSLCHQADRGKRRRFLLADDLHPQTHAVLATRAWPLDIELVTASRVDLLERAELWEDAFGVAIQLPATDGELFDPRPLVERAQQAGALVVAACDLLSLTLVEAPGEWGADVAVGSTQRFGLPMGFGGPHAAYLATREKWKRLVPGRVVGVSRDSSGRPALRLALQTREQHIRRDKATSNICTAQVLPAVLASMYAVYHGPEGLRSIARRIHSLTDRLAAGLETGGHRVRHQHVFDTLRVDLAESRSAGTVLEAARERGIELRHFDDDSLGVALGETIDEASVQELALVFGVDDHGEHAGRGAIAIPSHLKRESSFLEHRVFHDYRTETEMLRYLHRLESKDLSLTTSMIPLGSCTMKLNATAEMMPVTWSGFADLHPYTAPENAEGYAELCRNLEDWLAEITGFAAVSLQPNAGSQGEYAGLLVIRRYHQSRGESERRVCLIPTSAHGTNPASAVMAGFQVVAVQCDDDGNIDLSDLRARAEQHADRLGALMVTYPSTHGVFETEIREICEVVHRHGGQVYFDGANMNAQVGLCRPGDYGADVCHLNLHKTFCIPHGGGGPGMGPIGVAAHLEEHLPGDPLTAAQGSLGPVSAAPVGSGSILPISWAYIAMMGVEGLERASEIAILHANYMAHRLEPHFPVLYRGANGFVAHECILDLRPLKKFGVEVEDVAKRLMDYGFHAPTISWPVAGTMMIEPTESESKAELDRFCDALIAIREEVAQIERGEIAVDDSALRHAPHTAETVISSEWDRAYSREQAAFPASWTREHKYWPPVDRIDNAFGDRHLVCSCVGMEAYEESASE